MDAEPLDEGLAGPEALREVILAQRRQLDLLRHETQHANLLLAALESLLDADNQVDPFASVFTILQPVFAFREGLVLVESDGVGSPLQCIVASSGSPVEGTWPSTPSLEKVLAGRISATLTGHPLGASAGIEETGPALCLPLGFADRRGLVLLLRPAGSEGFDRRDITLARKFSLLASHAFATRVAHTSEQERRRLHDLTEELKATQQRLSHRVNHDPLTELPNRRYLEERVTRTLARVGPGHRLALAFIDLDAFKQVNDLYGHQIGDRLLVAVAGRIRSQIRSDDLLARISGDEFVLLLDPIRDEGALDDQVTRLLNALKAPFLVEGVTLRVSASIGLAVYPEHGIDYVSLRRNADVAMYRAKSTTRGGAAYFDAEIGRAAARRTEFEQELRRSVDEQRFRCELQPKVDLNTMTVVGFEALARRLNRDGELRTPDEFLDASTQLGLLGAITDQVLDEIVASLATLDAVFGPDTTFSFNLSADQATDAGVVRGLLSRLSDAGHNRRFIVELTEDAFLRADTFQREIAPLFRQFGVGVSIDDFGTGFASLTALLELTPDELKIDRAFVSRIQERQRAQVIVQSLAAASQQLGIEVVAEGVETADELHYLLDETPIRVAQGFLLGRPRPVEELVAGHAELVAGLRRLSCG